MARGINKVILVGNLGADPEVKYTPNGVAVANLSIATSEGWKDKQTGEQKEITEWHRVVFYRRLAEIAGEYLKKGTKVYVEGRLRTRKWQDQTGADRYTTEIIGDNMQMLDRAAGYAGNPVASTDYAGSPASRAPAAPYGGGIPSNGNQPPLLEPAEIGSGAEFDDDIPF